MIRKILFFILTFYSVGVFSQKLKDDSQNSKPTVYLIGSIHNMHFDPNNHYSINDLLAQIRALKPDLVCGEITPEAYEQAMEGYFPPEAAALAEMASELNSRFVPVDWRLNRATQAIADKNFPKDVEAQRLAFLDDLQAKLKSSNKLSFYDDVHDETILNDLDSLYEKIIGINPLAEIASGSWHERNRCAVENGMAAAGNAKVIVFVFGVDHTPQLKRQLKALGIEAQIPKRMFVPGDDYKVPAAIRERWKNNLKNLILIRDKKMPSTYDNYQKLINCKRIENITEALEKSR